MRLTINRTKRKIYSPPQTGAFCLMDVDSYLLDTSIGTINDMNYGGDLGGDSSSGGSIGEMGYGGDLGGSVTGGSGSKAFSDFMWGEEYRELSSAIEKMEKMTNNK